MRAAGRGSGLSRECQLALVPSAKQVERVDQGRAARAFSDHLGVDQVGRAWSHDRQAARVVDARRAIERLAEEEAGIAGRDKALLPREDAGLGLEDPAMIDAPPLQEGAAPVE